MMGKRVWERVLVAVLLVFLAMTAQTAAGLAAPQSSPLAQLTPFEIRAIAQQVRFQSLTEALLTPLASLKSGTTPLEANKQEELLLAIQADDQYQDIRLLRTTNSTAYLYSTRHVSDTYARILLRVEENNPYLLIAETVRENSEVYPRPTPVDLFRLPLFKLPPSEVERLARETVEREEYRDLHLIVTPSGALYLSSRLYLNEDLAKSLAERETNLPSNP